MAAQVARISAPRPAPSLWRGAQPLILASKSRTRRTLLSAVGLDTEVVTAEIDERALEDRHVAGGGSLEGLASELARAKALAVSAVWPNAYCLGADQTLTLEGRIFHKASDFEEAARSLAALSGKTHRLTSAFCVARFGRPLVIDSDHADLRLRTLDPLTISRYLDRVGVFEVRLTPRRTISAWSRFSAACPSSLIILKFNASIRLKYSALSICCAPARGVEFCPR